jgi:hypothetical protein
MIRCKQQMHTGFRATGTGSFEPAGRWKRVCMVWMCARCKDFSSSSASSFKGTYGSRRASHRRRIACGESRERYPFLRFSVQERAVMVSGTASQVSRSWARGNSSRRFLDVAVSVCVKAQQVRSEEMSSALFSRGLLVRGHSPDDVSSHQGVGRWVLSSGMVQRSVDSENGVLEISPAQNLWAVNFPGWPVRSELLCPALPNPLKEKKEKKKRKKKSGH